MDIKPFLFKQFKVFQDRCAMKIGTDGLLLGAWVTCYSAQHVLDIGTGTGLLTLMIAQRNNQSRIDAIEIESTAAQQAHENFQLSPWFSRIQLYAVSLQEFKPSLAYDLIICNPPYYREGLISFSESRSLARHTLSLSHEELLDYSAQYLNQQGALSVILPVKEGLAFIELAAQYGLYLNARCDVRDNQASKPLRLLMQFGLTKKVLAHSQLILKDETGAYSQDYQKLLRDFLIIL